MIDRRQIEFSSEDLRDALALAPAAGRALGLPDGRAVEVLFDPALQTVVFVFGAATASNHVVLSAGAAGALLMSYLVRSNIPLPRGAEKSVKISATSITIVCETELGRPPKARQPEATRAIRHIRAR